MANAGRHQPQICLKLAPIHRLGPHTGKVERAPDYLPAVACSEAVWPRDSPPPLIRFTPRRRTLTRFDTAGGADMRPYHCTHGKPIFSFPMHTFQLTFGRCMQIFVFLKPIHLVCIFNRFTYTQYVYYGTVSNVWYKNSMYYVCLSVSTKMSTISL